MEAIKQVKIDLPDEIIEFIENHGDLSEYDGIRYMSLPQWIAISPSGVVTMGLAKDMLPPKLREMVIEANKKRQ